MKISLRILLINFLIVVIILGSSFFVFYTIVYEVLTSAQTRNLRQSANNFTYVYRLLQSDTEDDFISLYNRGIEALWKEQKLQVKNIDFVLELGSEEDGLISHSVVKQFIYLPEKSFTLRDFKNYNPHLMTMTFSAPDGRKYVYGRVMNTEMLNDISQRINSDIALIWNGYPSDFSNQIVNQKYLYVLTQAVDNLKNKSNFELYIQGTESKDILATIYKPSSVDSQENLYYLIFSTFAEAGELRGTLKSIFIIIGLVGITLSLIFTMVFTDKFRKQVTELSKATEQTYAGKFDYKIDIKSKDEIGKLGMAFNKMLEELEKKEIAKNDYAEFITLINQNPSLKEISDVALKKILDTGDFLIGGLYSVDEEINLISAYGLNADYIDRPEISVFFKKVLETKQSLELYDEDALPVVSTGLIDIRIKYLLFLPIVYNNKPVALLELGSLTIPTEEIRDYLEKIKDQLAIGITNARALLQLEKLVFELKKLNEDYQKQNIQIKEQNETLLRLHSELKTQAEELERQKQRALELTDAKSKFLANMSHELRTPMNSILGLTELMLEKVDLEPRNKERLKVVLNSGKRLMTLINDILDLSKIEAGKVEIIHEDVLLEEIIEEISGSIVLLANEKNIVYEVIRNVDTHTVISIDRGKVVQVLINLLGNAVKYTDTGKVTLKVSVGNDMLNFEVIDTGIGIAKEEIDMIFEEFRQLNSSKSKKRGGTGLGLAISKKLAEILDGNLSVKSELNKGSTFTFSVPFNQVELFLPQRKQNVFNIPSVFKNGKSLVLVVDSDKVLRNTITQYLLSMGYGVIFADDGVQAIQIAAKSHPDAIILGVNLRQADSWDILKDLKQNSNTKSVPIILVSIIQDKNLGYTLDILDYLIKPITFENLSPALHRLTSLVKRKIKKIVVVDADDFAFQKYREVKDFEEIEIELVKESDEALAKIEEAQPDLIILDLTIKGLDGLTLAHILKINSETKKIPVLICIERELADDVKKYLTKVVDDITLKSNQNISDVVISVRDWLEIQESGKQDSVEEDKITLKSEIRKAKSQKSQIIDNQNYDLDILIVDDDSNTLFTLAEIVRSANCNPILANNGKECLDMLETKIPDLILLDIIMPEMDGFKTIKHIKRNNKWADIPVFAVTAKAMKDDNEIILKHGFSDYIPKPFNPAFITYKIKTLIAQLNTT
jgi:signal transduction histidine kinase/DNA-binding response OmpR family regulator/HAMP domain-containing protein